MFDRQRVTAILSLAVVWLGASGQARANLILNGDFEVYPAFFANPGSPITNGGWTFAEFAGVLDTGGNPDNASRLESNGLTTTDPTITQTVPGLNVGTNYTLSWDLALRINTSGAGTGRSFGVFLDSQTFGNALFLSEHLSLTYVSQSVQFTATAPSHTVIFAGELDNRTNGGVGNTDVSYRIDNIALIALPEPAALMLLGAGSLLMLVRRNGAGMRR